MKKKRYIIIFLGIIGLYVAANMVASQLLSPLFYNIALGYNRQDAINFLHDIKNEPEYTSQKQYFTDMYGQKLQKQIYADSLKHTQRINELKQQLVSNPKSRDILVQLGIEYYLEKDYSESKKYYQEAKRIDPTLHIKTLEQI